MTNTLERRRPGWARRPLLTTSMALGALLSLLGSAATAVAVGPRTSSVSVRPGMALTISLPGVENPCTAGFVFRGTAQRPGHRPAYYLATAGHCLFVDQQATEEVHREGAGPVVALAALSAQGTVVRGPRVGRVVYAAQRVPVLYEDGTLPELFDLGLIRLDDTVVANPAVCLFGGPTGLRTAELAVPEPLRFYGAGNATGFNRETGRTLLPGRTAVGSSAAHPNAVVGAFPASGGDSGSPIIDAAGRAVASLSGPYQPRIDRMLPHVEKLLGLSLQLRTAPLRPGAAAAGTDPDCVPLPAS